MIASRLARRDERTNRDRKRQRGRNRADRYDHDAKRVEAVRRHIHAVHGLPPGSGACLSESRYAINALACGLSTMTFPAGA